MRTCSHVGLGNRPDSILTPPTEIPVRTCSHDEAKRWAEATMTKLRALLEEEPPRKPWKPDEETENEGK